LICRSAKIVGGWRKTNITALNNENLQSPKGWILNILDNKAEKLILLLDLSISNENFFHFVTNEIVQIIQFESEFNWTSSFQVLNSVQVMYYVEDLANVYLWCDEAREHSCF
jgi:hypothetical protein